MHVDDLHYELPESLIAQEPCPHRDQSRMLVVNRADGTITEDVFANQPNYLNAGDCLALNDTRVIRARLHGKKVTGGKVEIFLLHEERPGEWTALVRPSAKVKPGCPVHLAGGVVATVGDVLPEGRRLVSFDTPDVIQTLETIGELPLPPYIHRDTQVDSDLRRYQTVYAAHHGAVAAPTAGLHFTPEVFDALDAKGVNRTTITLHVGYGTFKPISADTLEEHYVDPEDFFVSEAAAGTLNATRAQGGRIVAVGTTATRALETQYRDGAFCPGEGRTDKYIYPPYTYGGVDVLQTNFHLPKSSLLALVFAFAGRDLIMEAYQHAIREKFRFYSYGDVMLIL
ncbi:MAG: tRNA preQ1(34) S-adenosylmethionine ribosyltransferase-isomerase QueA [Candidatus Hydrogenedentes bacterium]|nr:tRNA preQ1(34) S-adenosylmethionine ribosyltransferase-isomerase QueA [Candidatus Hydrogenedentota bacterium]